MNSVVIIGNLTKDPELRYSGEMPICRMTVAVNDKRKNPNTGAWEDEPSFIPVVVFGRQAENCEKFLAKGRKVAVNGRIKTGSYQKQDGSKVYTTDVVANNVEFLSAQESQNQYGQNAQQSRPQQNRQSYFNEKPAGFEQMSEQEIIPF